MKFYYGNCHNIWINRIQTLITQIVLIVAIVHYKPNDDAAELQVMTKLPITYYIKLDKYGELCRHSFAWWVL